MVGAEGFVFQPTQTPFRPEPAIFFPIVRLTLLTRLGIIIFMIASFRDADAELLWNTGTGRNIPANIRRTAFKNLAILNAALTLSNLTVPPGNRLETLSGSRKGQHSIRVNDQYRICFVWRNGNAYDVEIVDYH